MQGFIYHNVGQRIMSSKIEPSELKNLSTTTIYEKYKISYFKDLCSKSLNLKIQFLEFRVLKTSPKTLHSRQRFMFQTLTRERLLK